MPVFPEGPALKKGVLNILNELVERDGDIGNIRRLTIRNGIKPTPSAPLDNTHEIQLRPLITDRQAGDEIHFHVEENLGPDDGDHTLFVGFDTGDHATIRVTNSRQWPPDGQE